MFSNKLDITILYYKRIYNIYVMLKKWILVSGKVFFFFINHWKNSQLSRIYNYAFPLTNNIAGAIISMELQKYKVPSIFYGAH